MNNEKLMDGSNERNFAGNNMEFSAEKNSNEKPANTPDEISDRNNTTMERFSEDEMEAGIESILFMMGESVEISKISKALKTTPGKVRKVVKSMQKKMEYDDRGLKIIELENSYQMCTKPEMYDILVAAAKQPKRQVLSDVMMETLSIVAYKQPVTRGEIEGIRGVKSDFAINKLIEYGLIYEVGRLDTPGRPILFGTTEEFLRRFGMSSSEELPVINEDIINELKNEAEEEIVLKSND